MHLALAIAVLVAAFGFALFTPLINWVSEKYQHLFIRRRRR